MFVVNDYDERHVYGLYKIPSLAYEAVKTLVEEMEKEEYDEDDPSAFPTFMQFMNTINSTNSFDWCGIYVDWYDLNRLYRK